jgi:hypothetical protein
VRTTNVDQTTQRRFAPSKSILLDHKPPSPFQEVPHCWHLAVRLHPKVEVTEKAGRQNNNPPHAMIETLSPLNFLTGLISSAWAKSNEMHIPFRQCWQVGQSRSMSPSGPWGMVAAAEAPHRCA